MCVLKGYCIVCQGNRLGDIVAPVQACPKVNALWSGCPNVNYNHVLRLAYKYIAVVFNAASPHSAAENCGAWQGAFRSKGCVCNSGLKVQGTLVAGAFAVGNCTFCKEKIYVQLSCRLVHCVVLYDWIKTAVNQILNFCIAPFFYKGIYFLQGLSAAGIVAVNK